MDTSKASRVGLRCRRSFQHGQVRKRLVCSSRSSNELISHAAWPCAISVLPVPRLQWSYGRDGALVHAREMGPSFDKAANGLVECHLEEVSGLIFICLAHKDQNPMWDFAPARELIAPQLEPHGLARDAKIAHTSFYSVASNWKLVYENNRECYHCAVSHPEYVKSNYDLHLTYKQNPDGSVERDLGLLRWGCTEGEFGVHCCSLFVASHTKTRPQQLCALCSFRVPFKPQTLSSRAKSASSRGSTSARASGSDLASSARLTPASPATGGIVQVAWWDSQEKQRTLRNRTLARGIWATSCVRSRDWFCAVLHASASVSAWPFQPLRDGWVTESLDGQPVSRVMGSLPQRDMGSFRIHALPNVSSHTRAVPQPGLISWGLRCSNCLTTN